MMMYQLTRQHRLNVPVEANQENEDDIAAMRDVLISLRRENEIAKSSLILEKNTNIELENSIKKVSEELVRQNNDIVRRERERIK